MLVTWSFASRTSSLRRGLPANELTWCVRSPVRGRVRSGCLAPLARLGGLLQLMQHRRCACFPCVLAASSRQWRGAGTSPPRAHAVVRRALRGLRLVRRVSDNIWTLAPLLVPIHGHTLARRGNDLALRASLRLAVRWLGFERPLVQPAGDAPGGRPGPGAAGVPLRGQPGRSPAHAGAVAAPGRTRFAAGRRCGVHDQSRPAGRLRGDTFRGHVLLPQRRRFRPVFLGARSRPDPGGSGRHPASAPGLYRGRQRLQASRCRSRPTPAHHLSWRASSQAMCCLLVQKGCAQSAVENSTTSRGKGMLGSGQGECGLWPPSRRMQA